MTKHGEFSHIEFPANDTARAQAFYSNVFGKVEVGRLTSQESKCLMPSESRARGFSSTK